MRVICINDTWDIKNINNPVFGEITNVIQVLNFFGWSYYHFKEYEGYIYHTENFAPLSEIDETEMIREYTEKAIL